MNEDKSYLYSIDESLRNDVPPVLYRFSSDWQTEGGPVLGGNKREPEAQG